MISHCLDFDSGALPLTDEPMADMHPVLGLPSFLRRSVYFLRIANHLGSMMAMLRQVGPWAALRHITPIRPACNSLAAAQLTTMSWRLMLPRAQDKQ
jgi:hypothetical protein